MFYVSVGRFLIWRAIECCTLQGEDCNYTITSMDASQGVIFLSFHTEEMVWQLTKYLFFRILKIRCQDFLKWAKIALNMLKKTDVINVGSQSKWSLNENYIFEGELNPTSVHNALFTLINVKVFIIGFLIKKTFEYPSRLRL